MKRAVLIVDDEFFIRLVLVEMLESRGYIAFQASHAEEAISIMTEQPGITAVLSDIEMPGTMDGVELVRVIAERWPPTVLILISGKEAPPAHILPARIRFLPKPVTDGALDRALTDFGLTI